MMLGGAVIYKFCQGIATTLVEYGVDLHELQAVECQLVHAILNDVCTKTNPRKPSRKDIIEIIDKISS